MALVVCAVLSISRMFCVACCVVSCVLCLASYEFCFVRCVLFVVLCCFVVRRGLLCMPSCVPSAMLRYVVFVCVVLYVI